MKGNKNGKILFDLPEEQQKDLATILEDFFRFKNSNYTTSFYNMLKILSFLTYDKYKDFLKIQVGRYIVEKWDTYKEENLFKHFEEILNSSHIYKYHYTALLLLLTHPDAVQPFLYRFNKHSLGDSSILSLFVKTVIEMLNNYEFDLQQSGYQGNPAESLYLNHLIEVLTCIFVNQWKESNVFLHNIFFREVLRPIVEFLLRFDCHKKIQDIIERIFQENYLPYDDYSLQDQPLNYDLYMNYLIHYSIINDKSCRYLLENRLEAYKSDFHLNGEEQIINSYSENLNPKDIQEFWNIVKAARYYDQIHGVPLMISIFNFFKQYDYIEYCWDYEDIFFEAIIISMRYEESWQLYHNNYNEFISRNLTQYLKEENFPKFEILRSFKNRMCMFQYPVASAETSSLIIKEIDSIIKKNITLFSELNNHYEALKNEMEPRNEDDPFIEKQISLFF